MCPEDLKYTKDHEWIKITDDIAVIGITDYAQQQLGDVVYVELPDVGTQVAQFEACGTIESVKTVSDLCAPVSGEVAKINEALDDTPELINNEPYDTGWIMEIKLKDSAELDNLLSANDYEAMIQE
jgi:glycine cleavage system H protein